MAITAQPPRGGIVAQVGGRSYPMVLRNAEIERFETHHGIGIFEMLDRMIDRSEAPQARHVRDLVALGLAGGGMPDRAADDIVSELGPSWNFALRQVAHDLVTVAFLPEKPEKKSAAAGSRRKGRAKATPGTSRKESGALSERGSAPPTSGK
ncbi:GTA-gp10 family protein [Oceaniglobus trochenteri]|uniref:GTA-gp10 family protein n=1 Tax=Oceaniglobus trochenteri TaxID=2763260 RepID=UPI001CFFB4E4|nr:GTA-gp10 family protein [Oceaniglobus trochenteri]